MNLSMAVWTRELNTRPLAGDGHTRPAKAETPVQFRPMLTAFGCLSSATGKIAQSENGLNRMQFALWGNGTPAKYLPAARRTLQGTII